MTQIKDLIQKTINRVYEWLNKIFHEEVETYDQERA